MPVEPLLVRLEKKASTRINISLVGGSVNMSRSAKKGPYIDSKLLAKILKQKQSGQKDPIKTWSRASQISPEFVGHTLAIHNGKTFINIFIVEAMVGYRLGEFAPTRTFRSHGRVVAREVSKT